MNFAEYSYFQVPNMEQSQWMVIASAPCEQFLEDLPSGRAHLDSSMQLVAMATAIPTVEDYEAGKRSVDCSIGVEPTTSNAGNVRYELAPFTGSGSLLGGTWEPAER